jgi:hypothetical protein
MMIPDDLTVPRISSPGVSMSDRLLADIVSLLDHPLEKRDLPKRLDAQWVIQFIHTTKDWLDWLAYRLKKKVPHDDRSPCRDCGTDTTPCDEHGRPSGLPSAVSRRSGPRIVIGRFVTLPSASTSNLRAGGTLSGQLPPEKS